MNVISALRADRHNIVDQLFEKIQTYKDESHTYYLILDIKNFLADGNTANAFIEIDENLQYLDGTLIKVFDLSVKDRYGDYIKDRLYTIFDKKIDAFKTYITTPTKKQIIIQKNDKRHLIDLLSDDETKHFLKELAAHETECTLEEDWLIETDLASKTHQINYYQSLKTDQERQIYATAIGQQYALDLLCSSLEEIIRIYDLDFLNTFFKTVEFKLA
jgi:hypothetical protein